MSQIHQLYNRLPAKLRTTLKVTAICLSLLIYTVLGQAAGSEGGIVLIVFLLVSAVLFATPYCWKQFKTWREQVSYEKRILLQSNHGMTTTIKGSLEAYYEFGWEGEFLQAFSPDQRPGEPQTSLPMILDLGDHLTIYSETDEIVWQGVFFKSSSRWKLPGARPALRPMWFWQSYRAELTRLSDGLNGKNEDSQ